MTFSFKTLLRRPFPHLLHQPNGWHYLLITVVIYAVCIDLLLTLSFIPWHEQHLWMILPGFGLIYMLCYYVVSRVACCTFPLFSNPAAWTLVHEIGLQLLYIPVMLLGTGLYIRFAIPVENLQQLGIGYFVRFDLINSGVIMAALLTFTGLKYKNVALPRPDKSAPPLDSATEPQGIITLKNRTLVLDELLYVESMRNKITLHRLVDGKLVKESVRFTMSEFVTLVAGYAQLRSCHASYMVHLDRVTKADVRHHALNLTLTGTTATVPVSNTYLREIKELLKQRGVPVG